MMTSFEKRFYKISGIYLALILAFLMGVTACGTFGYEGVDTTRKAIVVAAAETRAANLLLRDLVQRRAIGQEPAERALNSLRQSAELLQTALNTIDATGDPTQAENNLQRANLLISVAINILAPLAEGIEN